VNGLGAGGLGGALGASFGAGLGGGLGASFGAGVGLALGDFLGADLPAFNNASNSFLFNPVIPFIPLAFNSTFNSHTLTIYIY
jgi:hypothetical protein